MLLLANSKNEAAKKDLRLAYAQGNLTAYPGGCEKMARFLSSQYAKKKINNLNNNNWDTTGDKNGVHVSDVTNIIVPRTRHVTNRQSHMRSYRTQLYLNWHYK